MFIHGFTGKTSISLGAQVERAIAWERKTQAARLRSNGAIKLAGWTGRILTFDGREADRAIVIQYVIVIRGRRQYDFILYAAKSLAADGTAVFRAMLDTWRPTG